MEKGEQDDVRTSYLTAIDIWFMAMKAFTVFSLLESLVVLSLVKKSKALKERSKLSNTEYQKDAYRTRRRELKDLCEKLDEKSMVTPPVLFMVWLIYYVFVVMHGDEWSCMPEQIGQ